MNWAEEWYDIAQNGIPFENLNLESQALAHGLSLLLEIENESKERGTPAWNIATSSFVNSRISFLQCFEMQGSCLTM